MLGCPCRIDVTHADDVMASSGGATSMSLFLADAPTARQRRPLTLKVIGTILKSIYYNDINPNQL